MYLRQKEGEKLEDISPTLLNECGQLVKANSIEGSKLAMVHVVYTRYFFFAHIDSLSIARFQQSLSITRWRNLKKTASMDVGAIGYQNEKAKRRIMVEKDKAVVNALNKTKVEDHPNLQELQEVRPCSFTLSNNT